jgi:hypothetical protein
MSSAAEELTLGNVVRIRDNHSIDEYLSVRPEHVHNHFTVVQVKIVQAHNELRISWRELTYFRFGGEPRLRVDPVPHDDTRIAYQPEAVIAIGENSFDRGLYVADKFTRRETTLIKISLFFGEELENIVSRPELVGNTLPHRRRRVNEADTFVPGPQALRDKIHDNVVKDIAASIIKGTDVVARFQFKIKAA